MNIFVSWSHFFSARILKLQSFLHLVLHREWIWRFLYLLWVFMLTCDHTFAFSSQIVFHFWKRILFWIEWIFLLHDLMSILMTPDDHTSCIWISYCLLRFAENLNLDDVLYSSFLCLFWCCLMITLLAYKSIVFHFRQDVL